ncbi:RNA polymerase sigma factor [uncultured Caudovirales phage]|uniref:RNA polymerase sigma factor n=1 Tax=uncultured Caudovirales phage TaxID=2100421 RepID=A0A6J5NSY9_9CAUD|nr:RNA polymerase sigma factor [uncultured Caudovirales phage]
MAKAKNYINNKTLYTAIIEYRSKLEESIKNEIEKPVIPNYIAQSILLICNNLAMKPNFSGYSYKQDMISDAIVDCVAAVDKFNPDKTNNPFAYFTQIAWNAFLRRLDKEKRQTYIKHKNFENTFLMNDWNENESGQLKSNEFSSEIIKSYEKKLTNAKKSTKIAKNGLFI